MIHIFGQKPNEPIPTEWMHKGEFECKVNQCHIQYYRGQGYELGRAKDKRSSSNTIIEVKG